MTIKTAAHFINELQQAKSLSAMAAELQLRNPITPEVREIIDEERTRAENHIDDVVNRVEARL